MTDKETMKLALEALKWCHGGEPCGTSEAITALKEALAEHAMQEVQRLGQEIEQEPVVTKNSGGRMTLHLGWDDLPDGTKLYTTPPQRTWVGLTEQDLDYLCNLAYTGDEEFALAVQAKLMEKNA